MNAQSHRRNSNTHSCCSRHLLAASVVALAGAVGGVAVADLIQGQPIITPDDDMTVSIEFRGSSAGANGRLYFLGVGDANEIFNFADNSDDRDLGFYLFDNHASTKGSVITLDGIFHEGDVLHFAYDIPKQTKYLDLYRTDVDRDRDHFAFDLDTGDLGIEDLRPDHNSYDGDYNDANFRVTFLPSVPGPAAAALLLIGGAWVSSRRFFRPKKGSEFSGW